MTAPIRCLCVAPVGDRPDPGEPFSVVNRPTVAEAEDYLDRHHTGLDCVVVADDPPEIDAPTAVERLVSTHPELTVVGRADGVDRRDRLVTAGATDVVRRDAPAATLRARLRNAVARRRTVGDEEGSREKIRRLHDTAAKLERCESEDDVYDLIVETAERILAFDQCYVGTVEDGEIRPRAANADPLLAEPVIMTVEEGLAGKTVREGRTYVVGHHSEDPDANPVDDSYLSALSIPLGSIGLFQAVAAERDAFDDTDRELGELLMNHAASAIERVRYESALRGQRDRFAALFENVPDAAVGFVFEDDHPVVRRVNPAFAETFGYDAETATGETIADLIVPDEAAEAADRMRRRVVDSERVEAEVVREDADGDAVHCLLRTAPIDDDHIDGYAIYSDISALKERERQLSRQNARLQQFAGVVSHDLRSPLNVATGYLDAAVEDDSTEHVAEARASLARMDDLIDDLLTLARQGQSIGDPEPVDVETVVDAAWTTAGPDDVALERGSLPTVEGDESRLRELVENCFRNVGEHAPEATTVRVERLDDRQGFAVADDGPGIPPERRETAFETGHTTDPDGTGFGLAIVEEIAEAHDWTVAIEESRGGGAKLVFETEPSPE